MAIVQVNLKKNMTYEFKGTLLNYLYGWQVSVSGHSAIKPVQIHMVISTVLQLQAFSEIVHTVQMLRKG